MISRRIDWTKLFDHIIFEYSIFDRSSKENKEKDGLLYYDKWYWIKLLILHIALSCLILPEAITEADGSSSALHFYFFYYLEILNSHI